MGFAYAPRTAFTNMFGSLIQIFAEYPVDFWTTTTNFDQLMTSVDDRDRKIKEAIIRASAIGGVLVDSVDYMMSDVLKSESLVGIKDGSIIKTWEMLSKIIKDAPKAEKYFDLLKKYSLELMELYSEKHQLDTDLKKLHKGSNLYREHFAKIKAKNLEIQKKSKIIENIRGKKTEGLSKELSEIRYLIEYMDN
jgi:hypothetical protein